MELIILCGGSCVGKTTLEKIINEDYSFEPIVIRTTRDRREDDPSWVITNINREDNYVRENELVIQGVNGHHYIYELPLERGNYIVSIIDIEVAKKFRDAFKGECKIYVLDRRDEDIKECLNNRNIDSDEVANRLEQYYKVKQECKQNDYTFLVKSEEVIDILEEEKTSY